MLGYSVSELLGMHVNDVTAPEYHELILELTKSRQQGKDVVSIYETELVRKDESRFPVEFNVTRIDYKGKSSSLTIVRDITLRKETEQRFENILELAPVAIMTYTISGHISSCNQATSDMTGYSREELIGKHLSQLPFFNVETIKTALSLLAAIIKGEDVGHVDFPYKSKTGENKHARAYPKIITSSTGKREILVVIEDTTESTNLMSTIQESEERYHDLFDGLIDGFAYHKAVYDEDSKPLDYTFLEINERFTELVGLGPDIVGKNVTEVLPGIENDPADWIGVYGELAKKGDSIRFEQYAQPLDKWFSVSAYSPTRGYFATIFQDITEQKLTEDALLESEERLSGFMESATEGFLVLDTELRIIEANSSWLKLSGFSQSVFGMKLEDVIPSTDEMRFRHSEYRKVIETGEPVEFIQVESPSNMNVFYDVKAFKVGDGLGVIIVDVTEQTLVRREIEVLARFPEENTNPILRIDKEGTILYANTASNVFLDSWGVKLYELIPENWWRITDLVLSSDQVTQVDIEMVEKQWSFSFVPVKEAGYVNAYGRDVTEKKVFEDQLSAVHQHALVLSKSESIEDVGSTTLEIMSDVLGFEYSAILLVEDEYLYLLDTIGRTEQNIRYPISGKGITTRAIREEKTMFVPDVTKDPDYIQASVETLSEVDVPIMVDGKAVGVLNVEGLEVNRFTSNDARLMEVLASNVGAAISRLRAAEEKKSLSDRYSLSS